MAEERAHNLMHEAPTIAVGSTFARYQIVRCIGVGGMGAVFEATHLMLRKRVAIKTLHSSVGRTESARQRFLREAETVARIRHPNVVDISDVGIEGDVPYLVMEFLEGEDLAGMLERTPTLASDVAVDIVVPVASGLAAVHRLGIVHRDIKPENVVLARSAHGDIVPKLIDFGVSKDLEAGTASGAPVRHTVTGTPHYMSPEQARGSAALDARTDQYALAVVLYQCLSGLRPYDSESLLELLHLIDTGEFRPLRSVAPHVPEALEAVVHRAMARHQRDRFASTEAFGEALIPFASERTRVTYARDFQGGVAAHATALSTFDAGLQQRLDAATMPAEDFPSRDQVPPQTSSGVRIREVQEEAREKGGRRGLVLAAAGVLLLAVAAAGVLSFRRSSTPATEFSAPPTRFQINFKTQPPEAVISLDGAAVASGAFAREMERDGRKHTLHVAAPGYESRTFEFRDEPLSDSLVILQPVAAPAPVSAVPVAPEPVHAEPPAPKAKPAARAKAPRVNTTPAQQPALDIQLSR